MTHRLWKLTHSAGRLEALLLAATLAVGGVALSSCSSRPTYRTFATPEEAVRTLNETVKAGKLDELIAIFGPDSQELVSSSDAATGRRNREVFMVAFAEHWQLVDSGADRKELVIGNEDWPFPVPLIKDGGAWRFDTAAGKEEVLDRRIGRNELAVITVCRTYVMAQRAYASRGHDGKPAGLYARKFQSDPGTQSGLYWPITRGGPRSPLGELVAEASTAGYKATSDQSGRIPFHGYYFRILEGQETATPDGASDYVVNGEMSRGFALVAWPAQYDATGVMTFMVNQDGVVYEQDLGPETPAKVEGITRYRADAPWQKAQPDVATAQ